MAITRSALLEQGARNLREFGYPDATRDNILTDFVFRSFFRSMLEDNKGKGGAAADLIIGELIAEIETPKVRA